MEVVVAGFAGIITGIEGGMLEVQTLVEGGDGGNGRDNIGDYARRGNKRKTDDQRG